MSLKDIKNLISGKELKKIKRKIGKMSNAEAEKELKEKLNQFNNLIQNENSKEEEKK